MAVDESKRRRDMYEAHLGPDDQRIELGGWVYYVRAVKWERDFTHGLVQPVGELLLDTFRFAAQGLRKVRSGRRPWLLGVVRNLNPLILHRESLGLGQEPRIRIEQLAGQVRDGKFAPTA